MRENLFRAKPVSDVDRAVQRTTGMRPGLSRASLLPFYTDERGNPQWGAPQFVYDLARAAVLPSVAAQGGRYDMGDVVNMAANVTGAGYGASRVAGPRGAVLGMGGGGKPNLFRASGERTLADIVSAAEAQGVKLHVGDGRNLTVSQIVVPKEARGLGVGSRVMQDLAEYADRNGKTMALTPSGDFGGSVPRLRDFYARQGFVPNTGRNKDFAISEGMYRTPRARK